MSLSMVNAFSRTPLDENNRPLTLPVNWGSELKKKMSLAGSTGHLRHVKVLEEF
jgi:hypothetical protein